jgi:hypothetical protein
MTTAQAHSAQRLVREYDGPDVSRTFAREARQLAREGWVVVGATEREQRAEVLMVVDLGPQLVRTCQVHGVLRVIYGRDQLTPASPPPPAPPATY